MGLLKRILTMFLTLSVNLASAETNPVGYVSDDESNSYVRCAEDATTIKICKANRETMLFDLDGNVVDLFYKGDSLDCVGSVENKYKVKYKDTFAYVIKEDVNLIEETKLPYNFQSVVYLTEDTPIYKSIEDYENETFGTVLPKLECCEVYQDFGDFYLVSTNENIGYINKTNTEKLEGNFVVVDLGDQTAKLYSNDELMFTSDVITGKPSTPTHEGCFEVYDKTYNRFLKNEDGTNSSYVDVMMSFNNCEGLHDAEYHTNADGYFHGWKNMEDFGGDTYLTAGSHGCVNMPTDVAMKVSEYIEKGNKVLVKK